MQITLTEAIVIWLGLGFPFAALLFTEHDGPGVRAWRWLRWHLVPATVALAVRRWRR